MTIAVTNLTAGPFTPTGLAQSLPFAFKAYSTAGVRELEVYQLLGVAETIIPPANYTVTVNTDVTGAVLEGGTVNLLVGAAVVALGSLYVRAVPAQTQAQVWSDTGSRLKNLNEALDRMALRHISLRQAFLSSSAVSLSAAAIAAASQAQADRVLAQAARTSAETAETNAETAETAAEAARDQAVIAKDLAETAATDAATYAGAIDDSTFYPDEATGRAAVADGEYFKVITTTSNGVLIYRRTNAGASVLQQTMPSIGYIGLRPNFIFCLVTAYNPATNAITITPIDTAVRYTGTYQQYVWVFEYPGVNSAGAGSVDVTVKDGSGATIITWSLRKRGNVPLTGSEFAAGDLISCRRQTATEDPAGQRLLWMNPPNTAVKQITDFVPAMMEFAKVPGPDRPLYYCHYDTVHHAVVMRLDESKYLGATGGRRRHSDVTAFVEHDMATFQADTGNALSLNSVFSRRNGRALHDFNMIFNRLSRGANVDIGRPPTTLEPPVIGGKFGDAVSAATYPISGIGHGYMADPTTAMTGTLNDNTTGTIASVTKANPMVITFTGSHLYAIGDVLTPRGVTGMTQINDVALTVTAIGATTVTIGAVNSSAYGTFTGHTGGIEIGFTISPSTDIGYEFNGDKIVKTLSYKNQNTAGDVFCRTTHVTTYDPKGAGGQVRIETTNDYTHADVTVTPGFLRGFPLLWAGTDVNRCQAIVNGVAGAILTIDTRGGPDTTLGFPEQAIFWHSDFPQHQIVVTNNFGYGFSHKENGTLVANGSAQTYIANFDWGVKLYALYGDSTGTTPRDMTGIVVTTDVSFEWRMADPIA